MLWAGRYGRGAVDRSDALAAEVLVVLCWLECCCVWRRWRRRTQVTQVMQTGDAGEHRRKGDR